MSGYPWLADQPMQGPPVPPEWMAYYQPKPDIVTRAAQRIWARSKATRASYRSHADIHSAWPLAR